MYFDHAPKHMIRLSVDYRHDSKIPIRLWKSLVGDSPSSVYIYVCINTHMHAYITWKYLHVYIYIINK